MNIWLAMLALSLVATGGLLWAWRTQEGEAPDTRTARLRLFRERLAELAADRAAGTLDDVRYDEARLELENAAAGELGEAGEELTPSGSGTAVLLGAAILVPLLAFVLYARIGGHGAEAAFQETQRVGAGDLATLVEQLAERMENSADDLQGWMLLGRSRISLGQYDGAIHAWRQAYRLAPDEPVVMANLAEALVIQDPAALEGEAAGLIEATLDADPINPKGLWYGGLLAEARGNFPLAQARWRSLLEQAPPEQFRAMIEERLGDRWHLSIDVSLADSFDVRGFSTMFISVHETGEGGQAPLAVRRTGVPQLPARVTVGQEHTMVAGAVLLPDQAYRVVARLSRTGLASREPGDLLGEALWVPGESGILALTIDRAHQ